jgi:hypothetical protein
MGDRPRTPLIAALLPMGWAETGTDRVRRAGALPKRYRTMLAHPCGAVLIIETDSRGQQADHATYARGEMTVMLDDETTTRDVGAQRPLTPSEIDPRSKARVILRGSQRP